MLYCDSRKLPKQRGQVGQVVSQSPARRVLELCREATQPTANVMASSEPDDDTETLTCWICHSDQFDDPTHGPMIQPCSCRGSQRLCHRGCIEAWLRARAGADPGRAAGGAATTPLWIQAGKYIHQFSYFDHEQMLPAGLAPPRPAAGVDDAANTAAALSCPLCGERYGVRRKVRACRSGRAGRAPTLHRRRRCPPAFALIAASARSRACRTPLLAVL